MKNEYVAFQKVPLLLSIMNTQLRKHVFVYKQLHRVANSTLVVILNVKNFEYFNFLYNKSSLNHDIILFYVQYNICF